MRKYAKQGFIQLILIIVLLVIILSLLGVSLSSLFSNPVLQQNFGFLWGWISRAWSNYLAVPFGYLWDAWVTMIWEPLLNKLKTG
jgi:hypothetical protein